MRTIVNKGASNGPQCVWEHRHSRCGMKARQRQFYALIEARASTRVFLLHLGVLDLLKKIIYFTRGHIDTYLWWNRSPNCQILFFACYTNSSQYPLWNTSKSQERLLESLLISTLQILGNSRWCPREMA